MLPDVKLPSIYEQVANTHRVLAALQHDLNNLEAQFNTVAAKTRQEIITQRWDGNIKNAGPNESAQKAALDAALDDLVGEDGQPHPYKILRRKIATTRQQQVLEEGNLKALQVLQREHEQTADLRLREKELALREREIRLAEEKYADEADPRF
jgi:hypothetical protein